MQTTQDGHISKPTRTLLVQLSEMGMLYRRVTDFTLERQSGTGKGGMTEQVRRIAQLTYLADYGFIKSLCHFLHYELSDYHRLLAVLESQMNLSAPSPEDTDQEKPAEGAGLTLMRLGLWTEEMCLKMRLMAMVVDDAKGAFGKMAWWKLENREADRCVRRC